MNQYFQKLLNATQAPTRRIIGLMSGTSMDGIDMALCSISGAGESAQVTLELFEGVSYDKTLSTLLRKAPYHTAEEVSILSALVGEAFAEAVLHICNAHSIPLSQLDLIGSHGQTVFHHSGRSLPRKVTLQVGDGDVIASLTGVPVVADFRVKDCAFGGEGAPLTPYGDYILLGKKYPSSAVINIGGISNVTFLGNSLSEVKGFDIGPGNGLLDRAVRKLTEGKLQFDEGGKIAAQGVVVSDLLEKVWQTDPFVLLEPPKSTGFELYGDEYLERIISLYGNVDEHLIATLTEFTARAIADAILRFSPYKVKNLFIAGGGGHNPYLLSRIQASLPSVSVILSDEAGVPAKARECITFALLANDFLFGLPTSIPSVTGASRAATLGKLSFPS